MSPSPDPDVIRTLNESREQSEIESIRLIDHPRGNEMLHSRCESTSMRVLLDQHSLSYSIDFKPNVEYISSNGRFPVAIINESDIVSGFSELVVYLKKRGYFLGESLSNEELNEMETYISLVTNRLESLVLYTSWLIMDNYNHVTLPAYTADLTWPLSTILPFYKRRQVLRVLTSKGEWNDISEEMMLAEGRSVGSSLAFRLGRYDTPGSFFRTDNEDKVTELDCIVFGYLNAIFFTKLPNYKLKRALGQQSRLIEFCKHMENARGFSGRPNQRNLR